MDTARSIEESYRRAFRVDQPVNRPGSLLSGQKLLPLRPMVSRHRLASLALVAAIVVGGFLYAYVGTVRRLPILWVTVTVQADIPEGAFLTGEFGQHCAFDFINSWGEVETQTPIPPNAAAAIFVVVELRLPAATIGDEPVLVFMTGPALEFLSRLRPQIPLFTLELQGGEFLLPSATLLGPGESGGHRVVYSWSQEDVSFEVTETFTFQSLGPMRVKQPLPPRQVCF